MVKLLFMNGAYVSHVDNYEFYSSTFTEMLNNCEIGHQINVIDLMLSEVALKRKHPEKEHIGKKKILLMADGG